MNYLRHSVPLVQSQLNAVKLKSARSVELEGVKMIISKKSQRSQDQPTTNTIQDRIESQSNLGSFQRANNRQGERHQHESLKEQMSSTALDGSFNQQGGLHRIHIIGGAGSGKTTLACTLSARLNLPVYHLDEIYSKYGSESEVPLDLLCAEVERIATQSAWITEGIYLLWTDKLLRTADVIIWLDIPWRKAARRLLVRYVWIGLTNPSSKPIFDKLVRLIYYLWNEILWNERKYYRDRSIIDAGTLTDVNAQNRATTTQYLASYGDKLVRCCSPSEIETFLSSIKQEADQ
jgi:adenylate kinase family enzyme